MAITWKWITNENVGMNGVAMKTPKTKMIDFKDPNGKTNYDRVVITILFFTLVVLLIEIMLLFFFAMNITNCMVF